MMTRYSNWPTRLHHYLSASATLPFVWGKHDCCLFSADAVLAITGTDIAKEIRGKYDSLSTAHSLLKFYGGTVETATAHIATAHNLAEIKPLFAQRGDLVVVEQPTGLISGIIDLSGQIAAIAESGYFVLSLTKAKRAWRI